MDQLERAFIDPNLRTKAISKLSILRQKSRDIGEFLSEFEQVLIQAGGMLWSDDVRMSYLYNALNSKMLQGLVGSPPAASYGDFCSQLRIIEEQLNRAQRAIRYSSNRTVAETQDASTTRPAETRMDWEPTKVSAVRTEVHKKKRASRVSIQEVERRRANRLCIRCGDSGHFIRDCTMLAPERVQVSAVQEIEEPENKETNSGKE